ncbi:MAG: DNA primase [Muribaculum sp.]|nr:DNA primase [Muribaculum sp.]
MRKIDRETVQRILDTADIVDVVSDFVSLKRRGSGYIGLCPFHNERTPSFSVSKSKNFCKCFSCGKGGSPVNFIMEHEQLSYQEALRYLAHKYNIEIKEHEMSDAERERESERASMLAVNDMALKHFEYNLTETQDGRDIGLTYFLDRGINEASIKRFHLGYALERSDALVQAAVKAGYNVDFLVKTGLCIRTETGRVYDRFKGRVIFPVFSVSGKVIAFGGRTLKKDVAKYVNSPESEIYKKSHELYGLYQAKQAIVKRGKCILVEGYMDVISMHQSGIENVVASSGTSLTEGQIRLIHRFTEDVTVIYDGDAAGIKASLRGIDMLLTEGLNIKVVLLPDGDDPDSFAQKHTSSELEEYIKAHETDFIQFKTDILLQGVSNDPIARARVINDIVLSIAVIPNQVMRNIYVAECARRLGIDERVVALEVSKKSFEQAEKASVKAQKDAARQTLENRSLPPQPSSGEKQIVENGGSSSVASISEANPELDFIRPFERRLLQYVLRYGMMKLADVLDETGEVSDPVYVVDYVESELKDDEITFSDPIVLKTFEEALRLRRGSWNGDFSANEANLLAEREKFISDGEEEIRNSDSDLSAIQRREKELNERADARYFDGQRQFASAYIEKNLCSHLDDDIRKLSLELVPEKHVLSKVHTKYSKVETDEDRLDEIVPRAIYELKDALLENRMRRIRSELKEAVASGGNADTVMSLMKGMSELQSLRGEFAKYLGERILNPRK